MLHYITRFQNFENLSIIHPALSLLAPVPGGEFFYLDIENPVVCFELPLNLNISKKMYLSLLLLRTI